MNIIVRRNEWSGGRCRYCKTKCRWELQREGRYSADKLCDQHLGLALRNLGLERIEITHTATVTATVRP